jgi:hypothetical protein
MPKWNKRARQAFVVGTSLCVVLALGQVGRQGSSAALSGDFGTPRSESAAPSPDAEKAARTLPGIAPGLFGYAAPPAPPPAYPPTKTSAAPVPAPKPAEPVAPPPDPLAGYLCTGVYTLNDTPYAVLENRRTKESITLRVGELFAGQTVTAITPRSLTLRQGSDERTVALTDDFSLTPLDSQKHARSEEIAERMVAAETEAISLNRVNGFTYILSDDNRLQLGRSVTENVQKLRDDHFEGRITSDEYIRRMPQNTNGMPYLRTVRTGSAFCISSLRSTNSSSASPSIESE